MGLSRRRFLGLGALTLAASSATGLAACGSGGGSALRLHGWDFEPDLVRHNLDRFEQLNDGLHVDFTSVSDAEYVAETTAALSRAGGPDALYVPEDALVPWVEAGYLAPLDDLPGLEQIYSGMYEGSAEVMTYQRKRYGLPYYSDVVCLVYNAEMLEQAGFSDPPLSLEGLTRQAAAIKEEQLAEYPIGLSARPTETWWGWWWALVFASGGQLFDDRMAPIMGDSERTAQNILGWLEEGLGGRKVIDPLAPETSPQAVDQAFMRGDHAFVLTSRHSARTYNDPDQSQVAGKAMLAMVPSLDGSTQGTVSYTNMYCLSAGSEQKTEAQLLLGYLGGLDHGGFPQTARFWFKQRGLGFAFRDLMYDADVRAELTTFARPEIYAQLAEVAWPRRVIEMPWYADYEAASQRVIVELFAAQRSPEEVVQEMAAAAEQLRAAGETES